MIELVKKPRNQRPLNQCKAALPVLSNLDYFKKKEFKSLNLNHVIGALDYKHLKPGEPLFFYQDVGTTFCICLKGHASAWVCVPATLAEPMVVSLLKAATARIAEKSVGDDSQERFQHEEKGEIFTYQSFIDAVGTHEGILTPAQMRRHFVDYKTEVV